MVAAELGKGRIFVASHPGYAKDFLRNQGDTKLWSNVRKWLTRGRDVPEDALDAARNDITAGKIVVQQGGQLTAQRAQEILEYVKDGGSYFYGTAPWIYFHYIATTDIKEDPSTNIILTAAEISWRPWWDYFPAGTISMDKNEAKSVIPIKAKILKIIWHPQAFIHLGTGIASELSRASKRMIDMNKSLYMMMFEAMEDRMKKSLPNGPSNSNRAEGKRDLAAVSLVGELLRGPLFYDNPRKALGVEAFPGEVTSTERKTATLSFDPLYGKERHSTGFYLAAGEKMSVVVRSGSVKGWAIRIGAHSDELFKKTDLRRYPIVSTVFPLDNVMEVFSPFGGLIYLKSDEAAAALTVQISNVVEAPYLDTSDPKSVADWPRRKNAPAPWGEVAGRCLIITLPSSSMRDAEDIFEGIKQYDRACRMEYHLRGRDWTKERRERITPDVQISVGYMHSGYPIGTHLDMTSFLLDGEDIQKHGAWGIFHELGHNMQRDEWTFNGGVEVTTNIFSLYCSDKIANIPINTEMIRKLNDFKAYLSNPDFKGVWENDVWIALGIFYHIADNFGWESFKRYFREFETGRETAKTNQEKLDKWLTVMSRIVGRNLTPLFEFWAIPVSSAAMQESGMYGEFFLPREDDLLVEVGSARAAEIASTYQCGRNATKLPDTTVDENENAKRIPTMQQISVTAMKTKRYLRVFNNDNHFGVIGALKGSISERDLDLNEDTCAIIEAP